MLISQPTNKQAALPQCTYTQQIYSGPALAHHHGLLTALSTFGLQPDNWVDTDFNFGKEWIQAHIEASCSTALRQGHVAHAASDTQGACKGCFAQACLCARLGQVLWSLFTASYSS